MTSGLLKAVLATCCKAPRAAVPGHSLTWGQPNPETGVGVPVGRGVVVAERRSAVPGAAVPVAAANHAGRARSRPLRVDYTPARIRPIPVLTPFIDIPNHVIQSPAVR